MPDSTGGIESKSNVDPYAAALDDLSPEPSKPSNESANKTAKDKYSDALANLPKGNEPSLNQSSKSFCSSCKQAAELSSNKAFAATLNKLQTLEQEVGHQSGSTPSSNPKLPETRTGSRPNDSGPRLSQHESRETPSPRSDTGLRREAGNQLHPSSAPNSAGRVLEFAKLRESRPERPAGTPNRPADSEQTSARSLPRSSSPLFTNRFSDFFPSSRSQAIFAQNLPHSPSASVPQKQTVATTNEAKTADPGKKTALPSSQNGKTSQAPDSRAKGQERENQTAARPWSGSTLFSQKPSQPKGSNAATQTDQKNASTPPLPHPPSDASKTISAKVLAFGMAADFKNTVPLPMKPQAQALGFKPEIKTAMAAFSETATKFLQDVSKPLSPALDRSLQRLGASLEKALQKIQNALAEMGQMTLQIMKSVRTFLRKTEKLFLEALEKMLHLVASEETKKEILAQAKEMWRRFRRKLRKKKTLSALASEEPVENDEDDVCRKNYSKTG